MWGCARTEEKGHVQLCEQELCATQGVMVRLGTGRILKEALSEKAAQSPALLPTAVDAYDLSSKDVNRFSEQRMKCPMNAKNRNLPDAFQGPAFDPRVID